MTFYMGKISPKPRPTVRSISLGVEDTQCLARVAQLNTKCGSSIIVNKATFWDKCN